MFNKVKKGTFSIFLIFNINLTSIPISWTSNGFINNKSINFISVLNGVSCSLPSSLIQALQIANWLNTSNRCLWLSKFICQSSLGFRNGMINDAIGQYIGIQHDILVEVRFHNIESIKNQNWTNHWTTSFASPFNRGREKHHQPTKTFTEF